MWNLFRKSEERVVYQYPRKVCFIREDYKGEYRDTYSRAVSTITREEWREAFYTGRQVNLPDRGLLYEVILDNEARWMPAELVKIPIEIK